MTDLKQAETPSENYRRIARLTALEHSPAIATMDDGSKDSVSASVRLAIADQLYNWLMEIENQE